jgi:hypothetical protein
LAWLCVTVKVWPATVSVPVRSSACEFAETANVTLPDPVPDAVSTPIQSALVCAVHAQVGADAVMAIVPVAPSAATF